MNPRSPNPRKILLLRHLDPHLQQLRLTTIQIKSGTKPPAPAPLPPAPPVPKKASIFDSDSESSSSNGPMKCRRLPDYPTLFPYQADADVDQNEKDKEKTKSFFDSDGDTDSS